MFLSHSDRILARFQPGKLILYIRNRIIMKIWPISVKRGKTVWICRACHWGVIGEGEACVIDVLPLCPLPLVTRSRLKGHRHHPEPNPTPGGHWREVWVELCRRGLQTLTLCKTKIVHFVALFKAIQLIKWPLFILISHLELSYFNDDHRIMYFYWRKLLGTTKVDCSSPTFALF